MRRRSHLLDIALLGVLSEEDLHGYELKRRLTDVLGLFSTLSFGSMYPALARLEENGMVAVTGATSRPPRPSIPLTGSLGGEKAASRLDRPFSRIDARGARGKKVYAITDAGRQAFAEFLTQAPDDAGDDAAFRLRLAFARHLPAPRRLDLLEERRAYLVRSLARVRSSERGAAPLDTYAQSLRQHSTTLTEHDISWIDELIQTERSRTP